MRVACGQFIDRGPEARRYILHTLAARRPRMKSILLARFPLDGIARLNVGDKHPLPLAEVHLAQTRVHENFHPKPAPDDLRGDARTLQVAAVDRGVATPNQRLTRQLGLLKPSGIERRVSLSLVAPL